MTSIVMHYALPGARGQTRHFNYCALLDGDVRREAAHTDPVYSTHVRGPGFAVGRPLPHRCLTSPRLNSPGRGRDGRGSVEFSISKSDCLRKQNKKMGDITGADVHSSSVHTHRSLHHFPRQLVAPCSSYSGSFLSLFPWGDAAIDGCSSDRQQPGRWFPVGDNEPDLFYPRTK